MARASVRVRKTRTTRVTRAKVKKRSKRGNPNHCPVCGKFMGNGRGRKKDG